MGRDVQIDEESKWKWKNSKKKSRSSKIHTPPVVKDRETFDEEDKPLQPRA